MSDVLCGNAGGLAFSALRENPQGLKEVHQFLKQVDLDREHEHLGEVMQFIHARLGSSLRLRN